MMKHLCPEFKTNSKNSTIRKQTTNVLNGLKIFSDTLKDNRQMKNKYMKKCST